MGSYRYGVYVPELIRAIYPYFALIKTQSVVMTSSEFVSSIALNLKKVEMKHINVRSMYTTSIQAINWSFECIKCDYTQEMSKKPKGRVVPM